MVKSIVEDEENVYTYRQQSDKAEADAKARRRIVKLKIFQNASQQANPAHRSLIGKLPLPRQVIQTPFLKIPMLMVEMLMSMVGLC